MATGIKILLEVDDKGSIKVKKLEGSFKKLKNTVETGSASIARNFGTIKNAAQGPLNALKRLGQAGQLALAGLAAATVAVGAGFEQSMAKVQAVAGATAKELSQLEGTARQLGATTAFSASEASQAMFSLASAGQSVGDIKKSTPGVLLLAGALGSGLGDAAELATAALAQFGLKAKDTDRVVNVLTASNAASKLNFDRLKEGMANVGSIASATGFSLEETVAALGVLNNAGQQASVAGTGLKNVLAQLSNPNKVLKDLLGDVSLAGDGFSAVLDRLSAKGLDTQKAFAAFGKLGATAIIDLVKAGSKGFEELTDKITGTDEAAKQYAIQMNTVQSQFKIIKSTMEENMIAVFKAIQPTIRQAQAVMINFLQQIKPLLVGVAIASARWVKENRELIQRLAIGAAKGIAMIAVIGGIVKIVSTLIATGKVLWATIQIGITVIKAMRTAWLLAHAAALGPWGVIAAVAGAVIAGIVFLLVKFRDQVREIAGKVKEFFVNAFTAVIEKVDAVWEKIKSVLGKLNPKFEETAEVAEASIGGGVSAAIGKIADAMEAVTGFTGNKIDQIKAKIASALSDIRKLGETAGGFSTGVEEAAKPESVAEAPLILNATPKIDPDGRKKFLDDWEALQIQAAGYNQLHTKEWLQAQTNLIEIERERQLVAEGDTAAKRAAINVDADLAIMEAKKEHHEAILEMQQMQLDHFMETHELMMAALFSLEAGFDTFYEGIFEKEATFGEVMKKSREAMKKAFIKATGEMVKEFIKERLKGIAITLAAEEGANAKTRLGAAKIGAVKAYQAFAGIPIIGPALGAAAAVAAFAFLMAFRSGGLVPGAGYGDKIPGLLEPGEFVIKRPVVEAVGVQNLQTLNRTGALPPTEQSGPGITFNFPLTAGGLDDLSDEIEQLIVPQLEDLFNRRRFELKRERS